MRIEFTRAWRGFKAGDVTDAFEGGPADVLFRKGVARPAQAAVADPPAAGEPPAQAAVASAYPPAASRPRKK